MNPNNLLSVKNIILHSNTGHLENDAAKILRCEDPEKAEKLIKILNQSEQAESQAVWISKKGVFRYTPFYSSPFWVYAQLSLKPSSSLFRHFKNQPFSLFPNTAYRPSEKYRAQVK